MLMLALYTAIVIVVPISPFVGVLAELDPFYFVFELILPFPYERDVLVILGIPVVRLFLGLICIAEFGRFFYMFILLTFSLVFTASACLKTLTRHLPCIVN